MIWEAHLAKPVRKGLSIAARTPNFRATFLGRYWAAWFEHYAKVVP
jgi:hypothetical protein